MPCNELTLLLGWVKYGSGGPEEYIECLPREGWAVGAGVIFIDTAINIQKKTRLVGQKDIPQFRDFHVLLSERPIQTHN